jgi:hypothetical protein
MRGGPAKSAGPFCMPGMFDVLSGANHDWWLMIRDGPAMGAKGSLSQRREKRRLHKLTVQTKHCGF